MIADSVEAACKSLKSPSAEKINDLIDKIIAGKIQQGQLDQSTMTFQELEQVKLVFQKIIKSIYHVRIEYPDDSKQKAK